MAADESPAVPSSSAAPSLAGSGLIFRQLFEDLSSTYTYILADSNADSFPGVIIDPVDRTAERDATLLKELGVTPLYALNTHVHADHITGTAKLKGSFPDLKSVIAEVSGARADVKVKHGDFLRFGRFCLEVRSTPGHTPGCLSFVLRERPVPADSPAPTLGDVAVQPLAGESLPPGSEIMAFTGDALLIRACGRTDFQGGDARQLYKSVHSQILSLPPATPLYVGHDYKGRTVTTVAEELKFNPRLSKSEEEFVSIMTNLNLPPPAQIKAAVPANLVDGFLEDPSP